MNLKRGLKVTRLKGAHTFVKGKTYTISRIHLDKVFIKNEKGREVFFYKQEIKPGKSFSVNKIQTSDLSYDIY